MLVAQASKTAMMAAVLRGQHRRLNEHPWMFDYPYALALTGPVWPGLWEEFRGLEAGAGRGSGAALQRRSAGSGRLRAPEFA
jgi:hypothetical protein